MGTGTLGAIGWVDVTADVLTISIKRGQASEIEDSTPGTATVVLDNWSGAYDPLGSQNFVTNSTFEKGLTGWTVYGAGPPVITQSTTQVHQGHYSMQLTWPTGSGLYGPQFFVNGLTVGATYTWSAWVWVVAGPAIATGVGGISFGGSSSAAAWTLISQTFTATLEKHQLFFAPVAATTSGQTVYIDQVQCTLGTVVRPFVAQTYNLDVGQPVKILATYNGVTYPRYRGFVESIDPDLGLEPQVTINCTDGLANLGRTKIPVIGSGFTNDTPAQRLTRVLDSARWPTSMRAFDTGITSLAPTTMGDWALSLAQAVTSTELGILFCDASGNITFYDRLHAYTATRSTTVQATIDDSGSDVDFTNLTLSKDRSFLFNQAQITRFGASSAIQYDDLTSEGTYGIQTYPGNAGGLLQTDADAASLAEWLVGRYKNPGVRVTQVVIDASTQGQWTNLLPLTLYDRIRVLRRYLTVVAGVRTNTTVDAQLLLEGTQEDISEDAWIFTFNTRNTDNFKPFILGSSTLGVIGVNSIA